MGDVLGDAQIDVWSQGRISRTPIVIYIRDIRQVYDYDIMVTTASKRSNKLYLCITVSYQSG